MQRLAIALDDRLEGALVPFARERGQSRVGLRTQKGGGEHGRHVGLYDKRRDLALRSGSELRSTQSIRSWIGEWSVTWRRQSNPLGNPARASGAARVPEAALAGVALLAAGAALLAGGAVLARAAAEVIPS